MKKLILALLFLTFSLQISADEKANADIVFNWLEIEYPTYLPSNQTSLNAGVWYYRYYQSNGNAIGLKTDDSDVYFYAGTSGDLINLGPLSSLMNLTYFKFTTNYLNGKTFYNASEDDGNWGIGTITFTDSTWAWTSITDPNDKFTASYTITPEGYITYTDDGSTEYIKATVKTDDYLNLTWTNDINKLSQVRDEEYFFFELQKTQDFVDTKNAK